jgi:hypothetical protein
MQNVGIGPCPYCGAMGSVPDGKYTNVNGRIVRQALGSAIRDLGRAAPEELRQLRATLEQLRANQVTQKDLETALEGHLAKSKSWFSSPAGMAVAGRGFQSSLP